MVTIMASLQKPHLTKATEGQTNYKFFYYDPHLSLCQLSSIWQGFNPAWQNGSHFIERIKEILGEKGVTWLNVRQLDNWAKEQGERKENVGCGCVTKFEEIVEKREEMEDNI